MQHNISEGNKKSASSIQPCWCDNAGNLHFDDSLKGAKAKAAAANQACDRCSH